MRDSGGFAVVDQETAGLVDVLERFCGKQASHTAAWWFFLFSHNVMGQLHGDAASSSGSGLS